MEGCPCRVVVSSGSVAVSNGSVALVHLQGVGGPHCASCLWWLGHSCVCVVCGIELMRWCRVGLMW